MKLILYMDVYPGMDFTYACANARVIAAKIEGTKRYAITVNLPNPYSVDEHLPVTDVREVDRED